MRKCTIPIPWVLGGEAKDVSYKRKKFMTKYKLFLFYEPDNKKVTKKINRWMERKRPTIHKVNQNVLDETLYISIWYTEDGSNGSFVFNLNT